MTLASVAISVVVAVIILSMVSPRLAFFAVADLCLAFPVYLLLQEQWPHVWFSGCLVLAAIFQALIIAAA